jgi:hypothetical protein
LGCQPSKVIGYGELDAEQPAPAVYETLELSFENNQIEGNHFTTYARVTFSQGLERFTVDGFYDGSDADGDHVWRVRFMPNRPGWWQYQWQLGQFEETGQIYVRERRNPDNHGHVRVDDTTPSLLLHDDGSLHYWFGGKWFSAKNYGPPSKDSEPNARVEDGSQHDAYYTDGQFEAYVALLDNTRHNGTLLKIGYFPLANDQLSWDLEWIRRADAWVRSLQRRNIHCQINFFDPWSRTVDSWFDYSEDPSEHIINAWEDSDDSAKENYIRYLVARFASYSNVYWELVNRVDFAGPEAGDRFVQQANLKYLPWLRTHDPYDLPVGASDVQRARQMPDVDIEFPRQTEPPPASDSRRAMLLNELVHQCIDSNGTTAPAHHDSTIREASNRVCYRSAIWRAFVLGISGASEASWLDLTKPLNEAVLTVMHDHKRLHDFIDNLQTRLEELVYNPGFVEGATAHLGTRAKLGQTYVSYFLNGRDAETIQIRLPPGQYRFYWIEPAESEATPAQSGSLTVPSALATGTALARPAFETDLVLLIERE